MKQPANHARSLDPSTGRVAVDRPGPASAEPDAQEGFVERMFSGFSHSAEPWTRPAHGTVDAPRRAPLRSTARPGASYRLPAQSPGPKVERDSPATAVMTDLTRVAAVTVPSAATIGDAERAMTAHRVRSLFVVDQAKEILGIVTSTDLAGEKPIQSAQRRRMPRDDVPVRDVMTPRELLEGMELQDVLRATVGDVVDNLRRSGRRHALVIEPDPLEGGDRSHLVRGIFSLTQVALQLGLPPQPEHGVAQTFAEIELAIGR